LKGEHPHIKKKFTARNGDVVRGGVIREFGDHNFRRKFWDRPMRGGERDQQRRGKVWKRRSENSRKGKASAFGEEKGREGQGRTDFSRRRRGGSVYE